MPSSSSEEFSDSSNSESESNSGSDSETEKGKRKELKNQPFDEALDVSDGSVNMSEGKPSPNKSQQQDIKNQPYDHALELSDSITNFNPESGEPKSSTKDKGDGGEVKNKPFDEQLDVSDSDASVDTAPSTSPKNKSRTEAPAETTKKLEAEAPKPEKKQEAPRESAPERKPTITHTPTKDESEDSSDASESEDEDEAEQSTNTVASSKAPVEGAYNEDDYSDLNVSQEIKELFQYIGRFKSQDIELETRLKCFIPEYIPAVGEMDAFLKIPRPDQEEDNLGLKVLDEPILNQSDATVLDLQLRAMSKKKHGDIVVRSIENAEKNPQEIDRWIKSIADLHRTKPPPQVHYSKSMPDIDSLMQAWPEGFEEALQQLDLPNVDLDLTIEEYTRTICALLDVPVYKSLAQSLHVIFTLYMDFRSNQHFMNME